MEVREEEAVTAECEGITYYFCSEDCRDKFIKERTCARTAYDLIIIGGGPAGLTAAVYAATLKMEALLVAKFLYGAGARHKRWAGVNVADLHDEFLSQPDRFEVVFRGRLKDFF